MFFLLLYVVQHSIVLCYSQSILTFLNILYIIELCHMSKYWDR